MNSLEGQTFAGYEIIAKLGEGGMGAVWKARQPMLNRLVALKMMSPNLSSDPAFVARFIREASAAANLNHPNMVQVYTAGESDKVYYIAMEFVEGESLRVRLDRMGRIPAQEAVAITVYVAQALQYAWNKAHLIHRDIKPDNIFLSNAGEVKVGDLGLAKSVGGEATDVTQTGMLMGSPHYISPEQAQAAKDLDFRTDIYSLGCTLYHMLTGKTPYQGDSSMAIVMKHVNEPAPAIFKVWPACPMPLGRLVGKMVAKRRQERHQSYEDLLADLMQVHEKLRQSESIAPVATTPAPTVADTAPKARQTDASVATPAKGGSKKLVFAAAGVCAAVALAGLLWWSPWKTPQHETVAVVSQVETPPPAEPQKQEIVPPITSATSVPPAAQPPPEAASEAASQNTINLLPLVDVEQDAVKGKWSKQADGVSVKQGSSLRLQFPYAPPAEYDFRVEFTIQRGDPDVAQLIAAGGRNFAWKMGCASLGKRPAQPHLCWFEMVPGANHTRTFLPWNLEAGRRYTSTVQVRKDGLASSINDQTVTRWKTDYHDMSRQSEFALRDESVLGIGCWNCAVTFHRAEVREVTGKGRFTRAAPVAASALATPQPPMPTAVAPFDAAQARQHQEAWAKHLGVPVEMTNSIGMKFILIPPGKFLMGSSEGEDIRRRDEAQHEVIISKPFYMSVCPVTVNQFAAFVADSGYKTDAEKEGWSPGIETRDGKILTRRLRNDKLVVDGPKVSGASWRHPCIEQKGDHPVVQVSWNDANAFCDWLSKKGGPPVALPTEAQWEYTCRAGTKTAWPWGDNPDDGKGWANCADQSLKRMLPDGVDMTFFNWDDGFAFTSPVGSFKANAFGLFDMIGNAAYWCRDRYGNYERGVATDPTGAVVGTDRVVRGGSWNNFQIKNCRSAARYHFASDFRNERYGFRVVVEEIPSTSSAAAPTTSAGVASTQTGDGFQPLFNGRDLAGWVPMRTSGSNDSQHEPTTGGWTVEDGELVCATDQPGWLKSERQYGNFVLQLECKLLPGGNSGVYIRSPDSGRLSRAGIEIQMIDEKLLPQGRAPDPSQLSGAICTITGPSQSPLRPMGEWNLMEVRCEGESIEVTLNGIRTAIANMGATPQLRDRPRSGYIGLANWRGLAKGMKFRNVRIKELGAAPASAISALPPPSPAAAQASDAFQPLFNGRDLTGWVPMKSSGRDDTEHQPTTGGWNAQDGELVCATDQTGWLKTDRQYGDYVLQLEFKLRRDSNSDVYIRCPTAGHIARVGMAIQILDPNYKGKQLPPDKLTGAIYGVVGSPQPPVRPPGEWNSMEIRCEGENVEVTLNGIRTVSANMSQIPALQNRPRSGYIGIGNWHGEANGMTFRNIRIKELGAASGQNVVNLLPLIDPQKDVVHGDWKLTTDGLVLEKPKLAGALDLPYAPPEEYDFEIEFTPTGDGKNVNQYLAAAGRSFAWKMNMYGQKPPIHGLDLLDGKLATTRSEAVVQKSLTLESGQRYTSKVEVRRGSLCARVNGEEFLRWSGDFNRLSMESYFKLHDDRHLGVGSVMRGVVFHRIEVREVTGKGTFARSAPTASPSTSALQVSKASVSDDAFIREVAALSAEQQVARVVAKLKELNPHFDGKQTHKVEGGAVTELAVSTVGLRNLAPVSALKQLKKLTVAPWVANQKGVLADLSPLRELPLAWLYCQNNPISDLSPLKGLPLTVLGCGGTQVSDLTPLADMKLTVLSIDGTSVGDLSPLSGMPLTVLWCNNTSVTDFSPLGSSPLQELRCDYKPQRDAGALRGIPTLRKINDQPAAALLKQAPASTAGGDIRVLIVTGVDIPSHDWRSTGPVIRNELQKDPRMKVEILNDIYRLDSTDLTKFQAVLLNFYTRGKPDPNEQACENLKNFVNRGGGLVVFHSTCGSFRDWPEFRDLAGKIMDTRKGHDKQGPMRVKIANSNHPITRGMQPFETNDELYAFLSGRKPVQVLATAHAKITGTDEPMAFVLDYGKGRVFHFVLGHDVQAIQTDGTAELLRRGTAWVAGREPATTAKR